MAAALAAAGCTGSETKPSAAQESPPVIQLTDMNSTSPSSTTEPASLPTQAPEKAAGNEVQQAAVTDTKKPSASTAPAKPKAVEAYTAAKPLLMGIAIGDSKDRISVIHGKPKNEFQMDDGDFPLTVWEYEGFSVGFTSDKTVEFVEITSEEEDPGLNGLKLGQKSTDAVQALGKPDSDTEYVLSYKTKSTVLKLDVDPKTKKIHSIKLFGRS